MLLNHWPVEGLAAGIFFLAWGLFRDSVPGRRAALVWLLLVGLLTWLTFLFGEKGFDRVYAMSGTDAQSWLDLHAARAERVEILFVGMGLTVLAALVSIWKRPLWEKPLSWAVLVISVVACLGGGWIAQAGGPIRHSEFREGPPAQITPSPDGR